MGSPKFYIEVDPGLKSLLPKYLEGRKKDLIRFKNALEAQDFEFIRRLGHEIKGHGAGYGFVKLTQICGLVEKAAIEKDPKFLKFLFKEYEEYVSGVVLEDESKDE